MPPMPPGYMPGMYMPPMMPYPPPRQRGFWRSVLTSLGVTIFLGSIMLNFWLLAFSGLGSLGDAAPVEVVQKPGNAQEKIVILPLSGIITDQTAKLMNRWIARVEDDANVKAVVLAVDSPGGGVTASDQIHHRISELRSKRGIPIVVAMGGLAASGGYYVSCHADQIFAEETTLTGSIGVMMPNYNLSDLAQRIGVADRTLTAPREGFKNAGSMLAPEVPREREYLQGIIDTAYARFTDLVKTGRKGRLKGSESAIFDGRIFSAREALGNGLVDQIGYQEDAVKWAAQQAKLSKPMVVQYQRRLSGLELLFSRVAAAPAGEGTRINIQIDAAALEELTTPRLMYLWRAP
jgi:protease-4